VILSDLSQQGIRQQLASKQGLRLKTGPLTFSIRTRLNIVAEGICRLYSRYELAGSSEFVDYFVSLKTPASFRRLVKPQALFDFDGHIPFKPLPLVQAFPMLEWGMNWCIANHCHQWLVLHAAVIAKNNRAVIMPAPPGSGKSTLCAGLVGNGWRLLSDELAIIDMDSGKVVPMPRPVGLKNESIDVIREFLPDATIGPVCHDTRKGTVAHMAASEADSHNRELATPACVVFPKYMPNSDAMLTPHPKSHAMVHLADNAFNYHIAGLKGFQLLGDIVDAIDAYDFQYSRLEEAVTVFEQLANDQ
jgi:HprK-related kinase A